METKIEHTKKFKIKSVRNEKNVYLNQKLELDGAGALWIYNEVTR
jgi:hypothetical protein